jgi:hypothetical protein
LAQTTAVRALSKTFLRPLRVRALHSRYLIALISLASFWPVHPKAREHEHIASCARVCAREAERDLEPQTNKQARREEESGALFGRDGVLLVLLELFEGLGVLPQIDLGANEDDWRRRAVVPQL